MVLSCNKRNTKSVLLVLAGALCVYVPLNLVYVMTSYGARGVGVRPTQAPVKKGGGDMALMVKDFKPQPDGKMDLVLSVDLNQLLKVASATSMGSFNGEFTTNPLPSNSSFVLHKPDACTSVPDLQYVIYVHSAPGNVDRRRIIRSTWASSHLFRKQITKLVFMMGTPTDETELKILHEEYKLYGDIVQGSFVEHYRNLTLKAIMGLKWVTMYCTNAKFVLKADDDAFVNIFELMKVVEAQKKQEKLVVCPLWKENSMPILRDPAKCMKWCVRFNEFPGRTHFPKYCAGLAYLMSRDLVASMYKASLSTPFFWIDDVYITGLLPPKVSNVKYVDLLRNFTLKEALAFEEYMSSRPVTYFFSHVKKPSNFYKIWNSTLNRLPSNKLAAISDSVIKEYPYLAKKLHGYT